MINPNKLKLICNRYNIKIIAIYIYLKDYIDLRNLTYSLLLQNSMCNLINNFFFFIKCVIRILLSQFLLLN